MSEAMIEEIGMRGPVMRREVFIDPSAMVDRIRSHRQKVVLKLGKQLEDTQSLLSSVRRDALERQMLEQTMLGSAPEEEQAQLKAEEEARLQAEEEARVKVEAEARLQAEEEARVKVEEEARLEAEAQEEEARLKAEARARHALAIRESLERVVRANSLTDNFGSKGFDPRRASSSKSVTKLWAKRPDHDDDDAHAH